jgi:hypothetical protein
MFYSQQLRHDLRVLEASVGFLLITMPMPIILRPFDAAISMVNWSLAPEDCRHRLSHPDSP